MDFSAVCGGWLRQLRPRVQSSQLQPTGKRSRKSLESRRWTAHRTMCTHHILFQSCRSCRRFPIIESTEAIGNIEIWRFWRYWARLDSLTILSRPYIDIHIYIYIYIYICMLLGLTNSPGRSWPGRTRYPYSLCIACSKRTTYAQLSYYDMRCAIILLWYVARPGKRIKRISIRIKVIVWGEV